MAEVKWIKITVSMFDDEKIDFIESLPEADAILVIWIKLLTLAGRCNAGGYILLTENIPYTEEMLAHKFRRPPNIVKLALETFKKLGMLAADEKGIYLPNWEKHQNIEGLEKIREQTRKRVAKHRKAKALSDSSVTVTDNVTPSSATDIELDIDKDIIIMSDDEARYISTLEKIKDYPLDRKKDIEYYNILKERYPQVNLVEMIQDYATYKLDNPLKKNDNPRSQINTQCKLCIKWGRCIKEDKPQETGPYRDMTDYKL